MPKSERRQLRGLLREVNRVYQEALKDDKLDNLEVISLMGLFQDAISLMKQGLTQKNPEVCYLAYATGLALRDKPMTDNQVLKQAEKDGFEDPSFVLFLYNNAFIDTKENPKGKKMNGRNLGYGTTNGGMAKNQLRTIKRRSVELHDAIRDADELPDWVLSKITVAQDRLVVASDYILSKLRELELIKQGYKMNPYSGPYDSMYIKDELEFAKEVAHDLGLARMKKAVKKLDRLIQMYSSLINIADVHRMSSLSQRMKRCISRGRVNERFLMKAKHFTDQFYVFDSEFDSEDDWIEEVSSEDWG